MTVTLHVDLLWTDLEDFAEHFERDLHGTHIHALLGDKSGWILWGDATYPENPGFKGWELLDSGTYTRIRIANLGVTTKNYWIFAGTKRGSEAPRAIVQAIRFRRDRLKIVVHELGAWGYSERLQLWLDDRWEDAVMPNSPEKAPEPNRNEPQPLLPTRAKPEQWFAWFDWYYRQSWRQPTSIEHMARINPKSKSTIQSMHALYAAAYRKLRQ